MIKHSTYYQFYASIEVPDPIVGYWIDLAADAKGNIIKFFDQGIGKWVKLTDASSEYAVPPYIGNNGNWWVENRDTGVVASGKSPYIQNGTWWVWDVELKKYIDSGVYAEGQSAYQLAIKYGFVGTEAEWVESLKKPALDAAKVATEAAKEANEATDRLNTTLSDAQDTLNKIDKSLIASTEATIKANTAADRANDLSDNPMKIIDAYWWRYDEVTRRYINTNIKAVGDDFTIARSYSSIVEMEADYETTIAKIGQFVIIDTDEDNLDNSKLFLKTADGWKFISDLSGAQGIQGQSAYDIAVKNGFIGTEQDWITSLSKDSKDAAKLANEAATRANFEADNANTASNRANEIAGNPPIIQNGTWWFYNEGTKTYVNTKLPANGDIQYATFNVDLNDGILSMYYNDTYSGADFVLENGILKVII